jgi:peptidoglycan/xylan/chitin deacetylase (PgdA/CDA1 family)
VSLARFPSADRVYVVAADRSTRVSPEVLGTAPVLIAGANELPAATLAELRRLGPDEIVVAGDTSTIGAAVESALGAYAPSVRRMETEEPTDADGETVSPTSTTPVLVATEDSMPDPATIAAAGGLPDESVLVVSKAAVPAASGSEIARITGVPCGPLASPPTCTAGWIALTYDDGPVPERTEAVLAALASVGARATFFTVGFMAERHPEILTRIAEAGHTIANHSNEHEILRDLSDSAIADTINRADAAMRAAGVEPLRLVRPPGGVTDARVTRAIEEAGYREVLWTTGPLDYDGKSAAGIAQDVIAHAKDGAVVVLHDNSGNYLATMEATGIIVATLEEQGYCFGVLDGSGNVVP